jgi:hypothetical protein
MTFTFIYIVSIIYCLYKLALRANNKTMGGGIGETPALDTLMVLVLAPFLASMDILISVINFIKRKLWI